MFFIKKRRWFANGNPTLVEPPPEFDGRSMTWGKETDEFVWEVGGTATLLPMSTLFCEFDGAAAALPAVEDLASSCAFGILSKLFEKCFALFHQFTN